MTVTCDFWGFLLSKKISPLFTKPFSKAPYGVNLSYFNFLRENRKRFIYCYH